MQSPLILPDSATHHLPMLTPGVRSARPMISKVSVSHVRPLSNDTSCIEESTLRRFSYSLRFRQSTRWDRQAIWNTLASKHPLRRVLTPGLLKDLATRYQVNAAGIASALDALGTILPRTQANPDTVGIALSDLLERHLEATGHNPRERLNLLTQNYDLESLNVDTDLRAVFDSVRSIGAAHQATLGATSRHINLLFWGQPGTGKTEFAKHLAEELSMGLLVRRASGLLSMWVGGTEHNIREAFEEAERDRSILFIDEADSFFINRETASRSWEVTQTNELLTQMENHKGILICCTNMLDQLDHAVVRRFAWKIEFKPLTNEGKLRLYHKYFKTDGEPLSEEDKHRLSAIADLTPGDISAIRDRYSQVSGVYHNDDRHLIENLRQEVEYRKGRRNRIGFGQ